MRIAAALLLLFGACAAPPTPALRVDLAGDPLPEGAIARLGTRRFRTPGRVWAVAFGLDGRTLLVGAGRSLLLWDLEKGTRIRAFQGHEGVVGSIALMPDGKRALTGGGDGAMILWDLETGDRVRVFKGHEGRVWSVALAPDGSTALSAGMDGTLGLWNVATGERTRVFKGHEGAAMGALFVSGGTRALSGGADGKMILWDLATGEPLRSTEAHRGEISCLALSPDGRTALSGSGQMIPDEGPERGDGTLGVWDVETGRRLKTIEGRSGFLWAAFLPDGKTAVAGSSDRTAALWDLETGARGRAFEALGDRFHPVAVRGTTLACGDGSAFVLFDAASGRRLFDFPGHSDQVGSVAFLPDGRAATAGADGYLALWDPETGRRTALIDTGALEFGAMAVSPDGRRAVTGGWRSETALWDLQTGACLRRFEGASARCAAFGGATILAGLLDGRLVLWNAETGAPVREMRGAPARCVAVRPDGRMALAPSGGKSATLLDLETGRPARLLVGHAREVLSVAFSSDGLRALTGSADRTAILWDPEKANIIRRFESKTAVYSVSFGPDRIIVTGHGDGSAAAWDLESGARLHEFRGHGGPVTSVAIDGAGRRILTGSSDTTAIVWALPPVR